MPRGGEQYSAGGSAGAQPTAADDLDWVNDHIDACNHKISWFFKSSIIFNQYDKYLSSYHYILRKIKMQVKIAEGNDSASLQL
jgi:hypothetical protein